MRNYLLTCASNEDSDQPAHPGSLIGVFNDSIKKFASLAIQNVPSEDSDQTGGKQRLI